MVHVVRSGDHARASPSSAILISRGALLYASPDGARGTRSLAWSIDWNGKFQGAGKIVGSRISGDIAVQKDGTLTWAYAPATPNYTTALNGASPTTKTLKIASLKP